jgi:hypothetical protein
MKTKNIFKTLAMTMLMPTMLLTTACSNDDDVANTSNITNKGYALPVTVNVTRQDDGATRATYNDGTKKLSFSKGDKLFVEGSHVEADRFAGTLTWQSGGTFSGTIYTESPYEGTIDDLLDGNYATLLPAGYESTGYLTISDDGYQAQLAESPWKSFATSKAAGVEQLSFEHGEYTIGTGFALEPQNAILNFTITGLTPSTNVTAALSDDDDWTPDIEGEVTTDGSGNATFAMGLEGSSDLNEFSLSVAGNAITLASGSKTLTAGKIYNITRAVPVVTNLSTINSNYTANDGETLTGTLGKTVKISIADGATVTLADVDINTNTTLSSGNYAGITCLGTATIILKDGTTNSVWALNNGYPGIYVPQGETLTIQGETLGTGILNARGRGSVAGAGIGAASESKDIYRSCGNIVIAGGVINATAGSERAAGIGCGGSSNPGSSNPSTCGTITITGGTITATGGKWAPGIGGGFDGDCGDITIANTVTRVTATKGDRSGYLATTFDCIGRGREGACGTVKFGNQTMYNGSSWTTTPTSGSTYGGLSLTISQTTYNADTWTLTPVAP